MRPKIAGLTITQLNPTNTLNYPLTKKLSPVYLALLFFIMNSDQSNTSSLPGVNKIIAVASGKGGVGKSTTAVNLALALSSQGYQVGLLDADIYGPSVPLMLGIDPEQRPDVKMEKYFLPIVAHGLKTMSLGNLVTKQTPMVWRGPMASSALLQIMTQTLWDGVDFLIVDMPPGTGDIQLTLSQKASIDGAVIVTTPQNVALQDAIKGIEMFQKVAIPVLGIIENMASYLCPNCGDESHIFGKDGGQRVAGEYQVPLLGSIPLNASIREDMDDGLPSMIKDQNSAIAIRYAQIAQQVVQQLANSQLPAAPEIIIE